MNNIAAILLIISLGLVACVSGGPTLTRLTEAQDVSVPAVGESKTINIGEELYTEDSRLVTRFMEIPTNIKATAMSGGSESIFNVSEKLRARYYNISEYPAKKSCGYEVSSLTCFVDTDSDKLIDAVKQGVKGEKVYRINSPFPIKYYNEVANGGGGGIWFELIYSGKTRDSLKITYREFTASNLIRDAFTQNLEYPVEDGKVNIIYKGIQLSIYNINGISITYTRNK